MSPGNHYRRGHALIGALLLIVLVSILAMNGFRNSLLETRIADIDRVRELSFQQAESVLRYSEQELVSLHLSRYSDGQWLFRPVTYAVPKTYQNITLRTGQPPQPPPPPPSVSIQTISTSHTAGAAPAQPVPPKNRAVVQINVTTYTQNNNPAVQLQGIASVESSTGLPQRMAWRRLQ